MAKNLIKKIQNTVFQQELWKENSKVVVAVSGGPDSVCLLDVLVKLAPKYDLKLRIAHVNYGLRGKDSNEDENFVRDLAEKHGIRISVLKPGKKPKTSEVVLRETRYDFFEKLRNKNEFNFIAVAHNADDQVETFLMRIIRGSGLQGLSSMKYKNEKVIRPLLGVTREEIMNYIKKNKLKYKIDKTNKENLFFRNKIRNKLIPYLEKEFNPNIKKTISNYVSAISYDYSLISELSEKELKKNKEMIVSRILKLHPALQRSVIRKILESQKKNLIDIESIHIDEIIKILKSAKGKRQTIEFKGLKLTRIGDKVTISYK